MGEKKIGPSTFLQITKILFNVILGVHSRSLKKLFQVIIFDIITGHKLFFVNLYQNLFKMAYEIAYIFLYTLFIHFISFCTNIPLVPFA
jgi:hypothetical protein